MMAIEALVWVLTGMLAASLCSGLVQDCDHCDKVLNKFCCARKDAFWKSKAGKKKICCDFKNAEPGDCLKKRDMCWPIPGHPEHKPCCKGLSCEKDPQGTFTYRCIEKEKGGNQCQGRWGPSPYDSCNKCGCKNGCFTAGCTLMECPPPEKTKKLGEQCSIDSNNCVGDLVCNKLDFLPYDCKNGVGVCEPAGRCLDYVLTKAGHFCSDEEGKLDVTSSHICEHAVMIKEWGPFHELEMDGHLSKITPANCSKGMDTGADSVWNPNLAGKRNDNVQAICAVIGWPGKGGCMTKPADCAKLGQRCKKKKCCPGLLCVLGGKRCVKKPANCAKLGQQCKKKKCCPGLRCTLGGKLCVKAGGAGKPCKPKNYPCKSPSDCCSKRCRKYGSRKKCA